MLLWLIQWQPVNCIGEQPGWAAVASASVVVACVPAGRYFTGASYGGTALDGDGSGNVGDSAAVDCNCKGN